MYYQEIKTRESEKFAWDKLPTEDNNELSLLEPPSISPKSNLYVRSKYLFGYVFSAICLILLSPLMILVAMAIKIESRGPVLFKHKRIGYLGKEFEVYKFRTMINGAEKLQHRLENINEMNGGKLFKSDKDPRVTGLGKYLRKFSIDELPQLINILKGDMTIIGPRPLSTPIQEYHSNQLDRFRVKPGLGAIWQAYNRNNTDFNEWMKTDVNYVDNISFCLDAKLFFKILLNTILAKGAR